MSGHSPQCHPVLERHEQAQESFLFDYVTVPVDHHLAAERSQEKCDDGHRVRVVDVDYVIVPLFHKPSQFQYECRRNHGGCNVGDCGNHDDPGVVVDAYLVFAANPVRCGVCGAEHVALYAAAAKSAGQVLHDLFDTAFDGVEFAELQDFHFSSITVFMSPASLSGLLQSKKTAFPPADVSWA